MPPTGPQAKPPGRADAGQSSSIGIRTTSDVPAPTGLVHLDRAAERLDSVPQAGQAGAASGVGAAGAVVAHRNPELALLDAGDHLDAVCAGVLDRVGERLADDEVAGRLDVRRVALGADVNRDGQRAAARQRVKRRRAGPRASARSASSPGPARAARSWQRSCGRAPRVRAPRRARLRPRGHGARAST